MYSGKDNLLQYRQFISLKSTCNIDLSKFPFDRQSCYVVRTCHIMSFPTENEIQCLIFENDFITRKFRIHVGEGIINIQCCRKKIPATDEVLLQKKDNLLSCILFLILSTHMLVYPTNIIFYMQFLFIHLNNFN